jgi:O-antigen/teichoic acid export membrane protein
MAWKRTNESAADKGDPVAEGRSAVSPPPVVLTSSLAAVFGFPRLLSSRFRRDLAGTFLAQLGILGIGAFTGVFSARLLGPRGRGELTALTLWPLTLVILSDLGINSALVFHVGKQRFSLPELWTAGTVLGLLQTALTALAGLIVLPLALRAYPTEVRHLALVFLCFAPVLIFGSPPASIFQGELNLPAYNAIRAATPATYALGLLALLFLHRPYLRDVVFCQLAGFVAMAVWGYSLLCRRHVLRFVWHTGAFKSLLRFGLRTQLSNVTLLVNQRLDQLLLSLFIPARELGLYVVAVTVSTVVGVFPQAAGTVTYATAASSSSGEAGRIIARSVQASLIWLTAGCALLFVAVPWAIPWVFGRAFGGSVLACRILLPGTVALGLSQVLYEGARALNEPALPSYAEGCSLIITVGCLYLLVPRLGFVGAAIASTLAYTSSLVVTLVLFRRRTGLGWRHLVGLSRRPVQAFSQSSRRP